MNTNSTTVDAFDCHFHTTKCNGFYTPAQAIVEAISQKVEWAICTNHDTIDQDFVGMAKKSGLQSMPAVEVSALDNERLIHCLVYGKEIPELLEEKLANVNSIRLIAIKKKLRMLEEHGFDSDVDDFIQYWKEIGKNYHLRANTHITQFLFPIEEKYSLRRQKNLRVYRDLTGNIFGFRSFIQKHLRPNGEKPFGAIELQVPYPDLREIALLTRSTPTIKSLAHPDKSYADMGTVRFVNHAIELIRSDSIQAIEVSNSSSPDWMEAYKFIRKSTDCILTFGSDCRFKKGSEQSGRWIGRLNNKISTSEKNEEFSRLLEATGN